MILMLSYVKVQIEVSLDKTDLVFLETQDS